MANVFKPIVACNVFTLAPFCLWHQRCCHFAAEKKQKKNKTQFRQKKKLATMTSAKTTWHVSFSVWWVLLLRSFLFLPPSWKLCPDAQPWQRGWRHWRGGGPGSPTCWTCPCGGPRRSPQAEGPVCSSVGAEHILSPLWGDQPWKTQETMCTFKVYLLLIFSHAPRI